MKSGVARLALAALWACALACAASALPARAVDRSLGADLPKPAPSGLPWTADATTRLSRDLDAFLDVRAAPTLRGAHVGLLVLDTRSGNVLYAHNPDDAFVPASTFKLLTGSAALAILGPKHRFRTQALLDPQTASLIIRGGGDPLLRAADLDAMAFAVRTAGATAFPVSVGVDSTAFESTPYLPGWCWDDFPFYYSAVVSAATIEENVVHLTVTPGAAGGAPATVRAGPPPLDAQVEAPAGGCPFTRAVVVIPQARTAEPGTPDTVDVARTTGGCITVTGSLPAGSAPDAIDAAVPSAVWYLRTLSVDALERTGVNVRPIGPVAGPPEASDGEAVSPPGARVVWTHDGEPLTDLLADMWWPSDNLVAELLLREIGRQTAGTPGTSLHGIAAERAWLTSIGVDPGTLTIVDGSGLSTYDRITPRALAAILQADWNGPYRAAVLDDLPLAGVRGSTAGDFAGTLAAQRTFAKTGSMNHTRGLAGYLATLHHGAVTFAFSIDDWMGAQADLDALRARVLTRLIGD